MTVVVLRLWIRPMTPIPRGSPLIMVGVDGGDGGMAALRWAVQEAQAVGAVIEAVHAWTSIRPDNLIAREVWIATRLNAPHPEIRHRYEQGSAAEVLVTGSHHADLLVVGSRPLPHSGPDVLGPVAISCRRHAACSVAVIDQFTRRLAETMLDRLVPLDRLVERTSSGVDHQQLVSDGS